MLKLNLNHMRCLLVDDSKLMRIQIAKMLKKFGSIDVFHAENGLEAINILKKTSKHIDFIISDFHMPVMNGIQLLKAVRIGYEGIRNDIPFLFLTTFNDAKVVSVAILLDVDSFLIKPPDEDVLEKKLLYVLNEKSNPGRLHFSSDAYAALNVEEELTHIEFSTMQSKFKVVQSDGKRTVELETMKEDANPGALTQEEIANHIQIGTIENLKPDMVLMRDLKTTVGKTLYPKGTKINEYMMRRLKDIVTLGEELDFIYFRKP